MHWKAKSTEEHSVPLPISPAITRVKEVCRNWHLGGEGAEQNDALPPDPSIIYLKSVRTNDWYECGICYEFGLCQSIKYSALRNSAWEINSNWLGSVHNRWRLRSGWRMINKRQLSDSLCSERPGGQHQSHSSLGVLFRTQKRSKQLTNEICRGHEGGR